MPSPAQVMATLLAEYEREPYPSEQELARVAKAVAAPGVAQVRVLCPPDRAVSDTGLMQVSCR
jgi:hypothetical protein